MNEWQIAAVALIAAIVPCGWICLRSGFAEGVAAVQLAGTLTALTILVLAEAEGRQSFADLALVLAPVSFAGTLIFLRFLERQQ